MRTRFTLVSMLVLALLAPAAVQAQRPDADLADAVAATVRRYEHFTIFDDVNILVESRALTLTGRVTMPYKRDEIAKRVGKIDGLRSVTNNIQVLPVSNYDSDLRMRIAQAIYGHPAFWHYASMVDPPIHIIVEGGHVTLTGRVNSEVERGLAFAIAHVPNAFSVKNELKLDRGSS